MSPSITEEKILFHPTALEAAVDNRRVWGRGCAAGKAAVFPNQRDVAYVGLRPLAWHTAIAFPC